ncbi:hypothetical protein V1511DRAFT_498578 [Dipodascopsis uninucleata]
MQRDKPTVNRSPSILVTDARHDRRSGSTGLSQSRSGYAPFNRLPSKIPPNATGTSRTSRGRFSDISVSNIVFDGAGDVPSGRKRTTPSDASIRRSNQYRGKQRDPRLVLSSSIMNKKSKKRKDEEYEMYHEYHDDPYDSGSDSDSDDWIISPAGRVVILPSPPSPPPRSPSPGRGRTSPGATESRRCTAYLTAEKYHLGLFNAFLKKAHNAHGSRIYGAGSPDAVLYVPYSLPLLPGGRAGYRVRNGELSPTNLMDDNTERFRYDEDDTKQDIIQELHTKAELFIFAYGIVVFWNFTEHQERDILADIEFAETSGIPSSQPGKVSMKHKISHTVARTGMIVRPISEQDREMEEFEFEYSIYSKSSRIMNDVITLRPTNKHVLLMHKLMISHAIAQSTKLSYFETKMEQISENDLKHVPKKLALEGSLGDLNRTEVMKIEGKIFRLRVDVNLSSNILDVPEFVWEEEPEYHEFYTAVRDYLEIKPRISILNFRCRVFLDLADVLADSIAETNMSNITWIVIVLIVVSIVVSMSEIALRYSALRKIAH